MPTIAFLTLIAASVSAAAPLDAAQQGRLAALLLWADAYRSCYEPAAYSLRIDRKFTADCITLALGREVKGSSPDENAALHALIKVTPALIDTLNTPREQRHEPLGPAAQE